MPTFTAGALGANFDELDIAALSTGTVSAQTPTSFSVTLGSELDQFSGTGFAFGATGFATAGAISQIQESLGGQLTFTISGISLQVTDLLGWVATGANETAKLTIFSGSDLINGSDVNDLLRGYAGPDSINGGGGNDFLDGGDGANVIHGGLGDDVIVTGGANTYLRGDEGNDQIVGGTGFDDINGNQGDDTASGGLGDDWVVGGKDNDVLSGDDGNDVVWGNLGNDTLDGGTGNDQVRGGQGDDVVNGGPGDDFVSGDRGNDTVTGGSGADLFHGSQDAGIDRVMDFNQNEGDRVELDPGTTYTLSQSGADTIIDMGGGNQMILVGVQLASLKVGWIFEG